MKFRKWLYNKIISKEVDKIAMEMLCHPQSFQEVQTHVVFKGETYCEYTLSVGYYCYKYRGKDYVYYSWAERRYIKWIKNQWRDVMSGITLDRIDNRDY